MANDLTARPWFFDTPSTTAVVWQPQVFIKFIEWNDGASAAVAGTDNIEITDRNGKSIIKSTNQAAHDIQTFNLENWFTGLIIKTLSAGDLRVHVK